MFSSVGIDDSFFVRVRLAEDLDDFDSSSDCWIVEEGISEGLVACEDFSCSCRDAGIGVPAIDVSIRLVVEDVDLRFPWEVFEGHVVEDDSVMFVFVEFSESVHATDNERSLELGCCPLGFSSVSGSVEIEVVLEGTLEEPGCSWIQVSVGLCFVLVLSDECDRCD